MNGVIAQALGSALALAAAVILITLAKRRRSKGTYYNPETKMLEAWRADGEAHDGVTKRCRFCLEEASLDATSCPYCKRKNAYAEG